MTILVAQNIVISVQCALSTKLWLIAAGLLTIWSRQQMLVVPLMYGSYGGRQRTQLVRNTSAHVNGLVEVVKTPRVV